MKRALRDTDTSMFIKADGGQTQSIDMARAFVSYDDAVAFCRANKLKTVELVVHADDKSEYTIPVLRRHLNRAS
jgi:hypothetical protein